MLLTRGFFLKILGFIGLSSLLFGAKNAGTGAGLTKPEKARLSKKKTELLSKKLGLNVKDRTDY